jgi:hypothetical protein
MIKAGRFKARAIKGSEQYAESGSNKTLTVALDLQVKELEQSVTTFLYCSPAAYPYSVAKLRACGWKGDDITNLEGVDANEVDIDIEMETYEGKSRPKVNILDGGGGKVRLDAVIDKAAFKARLQAAIGNTGATTAPELGDKEIPF